VDRHKGKQKQNPRSGFKFLRRIGVEKEGHNDIDKEDGIQNLLI
jgi:hypothetical protein